MCSTATPRCASPPWSPARMRKWGEHPCAFIELKDGEAASAEDIIAWCRSHLAGFKIPKTVLFQELPKTSTGKVQKFVLRDRARAM